MFGVFFFVPHQKLLPWFDGLTTTIENPSLILECHEILLLAVTSAIHIPIIEDTVRVTRTKREREKEEDKSFRHGGRYISTRTDN